MNSYIGIFKKQNLLIFKYIFKKLEEIKDKE